MVEKIFFSQMYDSGLKSEWPKEEKGKDKKNETSVRRRKEKQTVEGNKKFKSGIRELSPL